MECVCEPCEAVPANSVAAAAITASTTTIVTRRQVLSRSSRPECSPDEFRLGRPGVRCCLKPTGSSRPTHSLMVVARTRPHDGSADIGSIIAHPQPPHSRTAHAGQQSTQTPGHQPKRPISYLCSPYRDRSPSFSREQPLTVSVPRCRSRRSPGRAGPLGPRCIPADRCRSDSPAGW